MKVLFLPHRFPYPPDKGDRIRSFHLLKFLASRSDLHLATLADEPVHPRHVRVLEGYCQQVTVAPIGRWTRWLRAAGSVLRGRTATEGLFCSSRLHGVVADWCREHEYDAIVATCSSMVQYLDPSGLKNATSIVDLVDVDSQKFHDYSEEAKGFRKTMLRCEARRLRRLESSLPDLVDAVTLVSEAEAELYRRIRSNDRTYGIPNGVDLKYFRPDEMWKAETSDQCTFVGALDYRANVDSICWFCREVWPQVVWQRPRATLSIVGRNPAAAVQRLAQQPGVSIHADVPDVRPYLAAARVVVAPLRIARGIQNKVLEALAMEKPVVATSEALAGLQVELGRDVLRANCPAEWIEHLVELFQHADMCRELGQAGREYVERNHSWEACLQPFADILSLRTKVLEPIGHA